MQESNISEKKRFSALIQAETYNKVKAYCKNNEIMTAKVVPGTILEIGLKLFFEAVEDKPLNDLVVEYIRGDAE